MPDLHPRPRVCVECGVTVRPGDGGVLAYGSLFCSEECADEREDLEAQETAWEIFDAQF